MSNMDWVEKDFYKALGVTKSASADEIKKAYRKLARANHPDSNPSDSGAEERFKAIAEAYDVIGDESKRKEYDQVRAVGAAGGFRGGQGGFTGNFGGGFSGGTADLGDLFGGLFGGGRRQQRPRARRGADVETETTLSFTDAIEGASVSLRLSSDAPCRDCAGTGAKPGTTPRVCPECEGTGAHLVSMGGTFSVNETCPQCSGRGLLIEHPCASCGGSGRGYSDRTVTARIPAGVKDGQRIRLRGKGAAGEAGAPSGDLYISVRVAPHPVFNRKDDHLTIKVPVAFHEAALGAEVKVPTLGGAPVTVRIPPGTPSGRTFRVRGKGVTRGETSGDLLVTVEVQVPPSLSDDARAAIEALRDAEPHAGLRASLFEAGSAR